MRVMPQGLRPPKMAQPSSDDDPYVDLIKAILNRVVADARGQCSPTVSVPTAMLQQEARAWLADERQVADLLELTGYDSAPVVQRVRQMLRASGPPIAAPQLPLC